MTRHADIYFIDGCGRCSLGGTPDCKVNTWRPILLALRRIILDCGLTEEAKWGAPCYTHQGHNILMLGAMLDYTFIGFFKGALLQDAHSILIQQTENVQAMRQLRFTDVRQVIEQETVIKEYIFEAIEVEKAGLKVKLKETHEFGMPEELAQKFAENPAFKAAFEALTQGRQRGYLLHFSAPKQAKTRESRIESCMSLIFEGKGLHDEYKAMGKK